MVSTVSEELQWFQATLAAATANKNGVADKDDPDYHHQTHAFWHKRAVYCPGGHKQRYRWNGQKYEEQKEKTENVNVIISLGHPVNDEWHQKEWLFVIPPPESQKTGGRKGISVRADGGTHKRTDNVVDPSAHCGGAADNSAPTKVAQK